MRAKRGRMPQDPLLVSTVNLGFRCPRNRQLRRNAFNGKTDASEAVATGAWYIKKAKVKAGRDFNRDGFRHLRILYIISKIGPCTMISSFKRGASAMREETESNAR
jgi:hypothetical protein